MKKLLFILVLTTACHRAAVVTGTPSPSAAPGAAGASDARSAVERYLAAVHAQDLQAMGVIWGSRAGPARDLISQEELYQREILAVCYADHDTYRIIGTPRGTADSTLLTVELTKGNLTRQSRFTAVRGPGSRWFMQTFEVDKLKDFCQRPPPHLGDVPEPSRARRR